MREMSYSSVGTSVRGKLAMYPLDWWMFVESRASMDALE
jgi:hypothetical protein